MGEEEVALKVCALIAAYNEAPTIEQVVEQSREHVSAVVVVDDGSMDGTRLSAERAGAEVLRHDVNRGKGVAVRTGLEYVLPRDYTHILFMDGDLQHDPRDIPLLLERAQSGPGDFVVAEREFRKSEMPPARFYANRIGSRVMSRIIGTPIGDSQTGFRLIRSHYLRAVRLTARRYEVEAEILIKVVRQGATLDRVVVPTTYTNVRSKLRPFRDVFRICMLTMHYRFLC